MTPNQIIQRRTSLAMTKTEFGVALGLTDRGARVTVWRWEKGKTTPLSTDAHAHGPTSLTETKNEIKLLRLMLHPATVSAIVRHQQTEIDMTSTCTACHAEAELFRAHGNLCEACVIAAKTKVLAKQVEFYHFLNVGDYVGIRYEKNASSRYGRIVAVIPLNANKPWSPRQMHGNCYAKLRVQMHDGSIRDEHPEHLTEAKPPMSDLGQSLFDMMTGVGKAQAMQAEIDAFFSRRD